MSDTMTFVSLLRSDSAAQQWELTVQRQAAWMRPALVPPDPNDVPADVRQALLRWLVEADDMKPTSVSSGVSGTTRKDNDE